MSKSSLIHGLPSFVLQDTPLGKGIHHNLAPSFKTLTNQKNDRNSETGQQLSMAYFKQTNLSLSFKATYTKVGRLGSGGFDGGLPASVDVLPFDIGAIKDIFNSVLKAFDLSKDEEVALNGVSSPEDFLKKLIVEKLFGKSTDESSIDVQHVQVYKEQQQKIDFSLDYSGIAKWRGSVFQTKFHLEFHLEQKEISYIDCMKTLNGLNRLDEQNVDTGRYLISFENATSVTIFDKFSRLSTTVWGDPHVDLSDIEGRINGEFADLKESRILTTLKLLDRTTVVIKAPDNGLIEEVHIFKGNDHIKGLGKGSRSRDLESDERRKTHDNIKEGTFGPVDQLVRLIDRFVPVSDVVKVGGDGNDWFDENGLLVWGG